MPAHRAGFAGIRTHAPRLTRHWTGVIDVAQVIVAQGTFGLFLGIMWWRYRNLLAIILVPIIANGWGVAAALISP